MKTLHETIAAARYAARMSLTDLSKVTGLSTPTLSNIETGKMVEPSFYKIAKIAIAIGLNIGDLAKTEMKSNCSPATRKLRARTARRNWKNPNTAAKTMETQTLTVPIRGGGDTSISGEVVGPFLIHRPAGFSWGGFKLWQVTHVKSGLRFPWDFEKKEIARRFARRVRKMTDWENVGARMGDDPTSAKGVFTTDLPTPEQREKIKALAASLPSTHATTQGE